MKENKIFPLFFKFSTFLILFTILSSLLPFFTVLSDDGIAALQFTAEQQARLEALVGNIVSQMSFLDRLAGGRALLRSLHGLCYQTVQSTVLQHFPALHASVISHIESSTILNVQDFLASNTVPPTGHLGQISKQNLESFCRAYSGMLTRQAEIIAAFERGETPDPQAIKGFLHTSGYADYILKHVKSPNWEHIDMLRRKLDAGTMFPKRKF